MKVLLDYRPESQVIFVQFSEQKSANILLLAIRVSALYYRFCFVSGANKESHKRKTARIINVAEPSEEDHPWLAGIIKIVESNVPGKTVEGYCTGALITKRYN